MARIKAGASCVKGAEKTLTAMHPTIRTLKNALVLLQQGPTVCMQKFRPCTCICLGRSTACGQQSTSHKRKQALALGKLPTKGPRLHTNKLTNQAVWLAQGEPGSCWCCVSTCMQKRNK
jgi:hypothetical protein